MNGDIVQRLREILRGKNLDSILIGSRANVRYTTGFTGDYGFAAVGLLEPHFFTSPLYSEHARCTVGEPFSVVEVESGVFRAMAELGKAFWGRRVGYEADVVTCSAFEKLKAAFGGVELVPTTGIVEELRSVKNPGEISSISGAQRIAEEVLEEVLELLKEGVRERELALEIDYRFRKKGGERPAFDTIAAFGENSSKPHALPADRRLRRGDIVLIDMGTVVDGYASDMTRTFVFGRADAETRKVYSTVLDAQEAALEGIRAGVSCAEADALARRVIERAGYGERFVHSLGHGVGLEVHEIPRLSKDSDVTLKENMVVTVEPGIYIPGWGGVRIEDMVVVGGDGCGNLTRAPKTLLEL